ncbi:alkaline phosphatase family protein [Treponema sp. OMZ 840]|uniref:alkaline phosphatase family protein n=1 Tax=Treponema sp. OMZ 840 TaxID=244313 RepID=UPI003D8C53D3
MNKVLLISFDAVGCDELDELLALPNFSRLAGQGMLFRDMKTVFVSNTYPVHTSVATGVPPNKHGIISNTFIDPAEEGVWCYDSRRIGAKTLWQAAREKGLKTAAVLWPVTGYAKDIHWNLPEVVIRKGENQVVQNLKAGSFFIQMQAFFRHRHLMHGISQPALDNFAVHVMRDIIREKKPDFMLLHLTSFDTICHEYGRKAPETKKALEYLDGFLGQICAVLEKNTSVIVFSDHAQLDVHTNLHPNKMLETAGFLKQTESYDEVFKKKVNIISDYRYFFHYAGGSAFLFAKDPTDKKSEEIARIKKAVLDIEGVERLLSVEEMKESGFDAPSPLYSSGALFGVCAKKGCHFGDTHYEKGTHGYPLDRPHYGVFCAVNKKTDGFVCSSVLDVTKLAALLLGVSM